MDLSWGCGVFLASIFVLFNLFGQLGGCVMVLLQMRVTEACGILFFIVVLQVSNESGTGCPKEERAHHLLSGYIFLRRLSPTALYGIYSFCYEI